MIPLATPLSGIKGIAPRFLKHFEKLGIVTVEDLLWHFPVRYEDFSEIVPIASLEPGQHATIQGIIEKIKIRQSFRRRFVIVEAVIADDSGSIKATWFNQPYLLNVFRQGRRANFSGTVTANEDAFHLSHPVYELLSDAKNKTENNIHTGRLVPIYPETRGLTSRGIRFFLEPILKHVERIPEWLPGEALKTAQLPDVNRALRDIHFPATFDDAERARKRFSFEELFLLQIFNLRRRQAAAEERAQPLVTDIEKFKTIIANLPFTLTPSQKKSLWEIIQDLAKTKPMNRLLQGDVGSGKTVVAALAALIAAENRAQAAFMAPTEILARQHFLTLKKLFTHIAQKNQPAIALLTSNESKILYENDLESGITKRALLKETRNGKVKIVVGTHALIQKNVEFEKLSLVVVDEQHRFGVKQRQALLRASGQQLSTSMPHLLSMSATPIPRTLMLTIFGDLDISTITELPSGRKPILTKIVAPANRPKAYEFIRQQIKKGRQAFVICPRITADQDADQRGYDISDNQRNNPRKSAVLTEVKTVMDEYEKLSKTIFPDLRVAMLHGKMKPKEKETVMKQFASGASDILVSTSVVEVGVDVPNATIMMIEGAERFGLAQLYQFRGRVGRGAHQSFCFLFTESNAKTVHDRLNAILEAKNGFELAEKDLKLRGPGEFIGQKQTGLPDIAMRGLQDIELVRLSRAAALASANLLKSNFDRTSVLLKERLAEFEKKIHLE